jgi:hypothetical protein
LSRGIYYQFPELSVRNRQMIYIHHPESVTA